MPDEPNIGQGSEPIPVDDGQDSGDVQTPEMIRIGDEEMTRDNFIKSYQELRKDHTQKSMSLAERERQLQELAWASPIQERYYSNPAFREGYDALWEDQGQQAARQVTPDNPEIARLRMDTERLKQDREFDRLRSEGLNISRDDESQVLSLISTSPSIRDVEAAYRKLFWKRDAEMIRKQTTTETAQHMADNKNSYRALPKGRQGSSSKKDPNKMTKEEREGHILAEITNMDWD